MNFKKTHDSFKQIVNTINKMPKKQATVIIGIDGCGGSGKSTLANRIKEECSNVTVVHMDDFYLPSQQIIHAHPRNKPIGADFDWKRVLDQVLEPLTSDKEGKYQRYDWDSDALAEWHTVPVGGIVIVEGVYAIRQELAAKYDLKIWVDCPREIRLSRGIERDGEEAREIWEENWMLSEDIYIDEHRPMERADIVVIGI